MVTHSSILAWRVPWTEEYSRLQIHGVTKRRVRLTDFHFTSLLGDSEGLGSLAFCSPWAHKELDMT